MTKPKKFDIRLGVKEIRSCAKFLLDSPGEVDPKVKLGVRVMRDMALGAIKIRRDSLRRDRGIIVLSDRPGSKEANS